MVRIKLVKRKIKNPTGYFSQEFIAHINRCEALQGKMILKDNYDNLKVKDDDSMQKV